MSHTGPLMRIASILLIIFTATYVMLAHCQQYDDVVGVYCHICYFEFVTLKSSPTIHKLPYYQYMATLLKGLY